MKNNVVQMFTDKKPKPTNKQRRLLSALRVGVEVWRIKLGTPAWIWWSPPNHNTPIERWNRQVVRECIKIGWATTTHKPSSLSPDRLTITRLGQDALTRA